MHSTPQRVAVDVAGWLALVRPFTLGPPAVGVLAGGIAAAGSLAHRGVDLTTTLAMVAGPLLLVALSAGTLNAASNVLNQLAERPLDALNKPERPLPAGRVSVHAAAIATSLLYAMGLALAFAAVGPSGGHEPGWCMLGATVCTFAYSLPPLYTKSRGWWANVTIAIPRGGLVKLAGWAAVDHGLEDPEPWLVALVFTGFVLGTASTKDFADAVGDRRCGCMTLVVRYGAVRVARWVRIAFVAPWLLLAALTPWLHARPAALVAVALALAAAGILAGLPLRDLERRGLEANHPAWRGMYLLMMLAQAGIALAYLV